ncbi:MAG: O-antigen ligase family protein [Clostridium sp.]|uniref:O-antigen ligase family protein n=1 Tax=Clostridium sp. TaxID=1506 RepID=UPI0025B843C4|nr:O-antigen ligase family protein [Clostridium sp.]MCE5221714.1 O-antigen ligase family protein [Clostridium sp.]
MKEIIKNIYKYVDNKFYFKLLYLFVSLTTVTMLKYVPGIRVLNYIALAWGIILILLMVFKNYKYRKIYRFDIPLILLIIVTFILNVTVYRNVENIKVWLINLILFVTIFTVDIFRNKKNIIKEMNIITYFYAIFMFIASSISLIMKIFNIKIELGDVIFELGGIHGGIFENKNAISIATAIAMVMCIYLSSIAKMNKEKIFWIFNILLQLTTMINSNGRSALLIVIAVVYLFTFAYYKNKYLRGALIILSVIAIFGVSFLVSEETVRIFTSGRSSLWTSGIMAIEKHPLIGVGYNNFTDAVRSARDTTDLPGLDYGGVHNIYLQITIINGIVSLALLLLFLILFLIFIIKHLDKLKKKDKLQMTTLTSMLVGILAVNLFESNLVYIISFISIIFWIYAGYLVSILDNRNVE